MLYYMRFGCIIFLICIASLKPLISIWRVVRVVDRAALEISAGSGNFVPSKTLANSGFPKIQIEYFLAFSPAFLSKGFLSALETTRIAGGNRHGAISKWS